MDRTPSIGFTLWSFVWSNLRIRPLRTALAVLGVALEVFLVLLIVGMTSGVVAEWAERVQGVGADILVQPPNSSIFLAFSSPVMQESLAAKIAALRSVDQVAPVLVAADTRTLDVVYGIDYDSFSSLSDGFVFRAGRRFDGADEVVIDDIKSESKHLKVGDRVTLLGHEFTICGIVASGKGARYYIPLRSAQDLVGAENRVSIFYVRSTGNTDATRQDLTALLPGNRILSMAEYLTLMNSSNLPELRPFINSMVGLGIAISFLIVLLTMHTMVMERTREIGILKALGASRLAILRFVMQETFLMALLGAAFGLACTYGVRAVLKQTTPTLRIDISADWVLRAILLALVGALGGALYPAYRAARIDPVDALAYE